MRRAPGSRTAKTAMHRQARPRPRMLSVKGGGCPDLGSKAGTFMIAAQDREEKKDGMIRDDFQSVVAQGYDAVYAALPGSPTLQNIWRMHVLGPDYPKGFDHISFLTFAELRRIKLELGVARGACFADLACGMGGPGLWIARESGALLRGIDLSA